MNPTANAEVQGVQAPITPQKVSRPGGRDDAGQNSTQLKLNYESNFNHFIKLLNNSPDQVEDLMRLLMEKKELLVQAGMNKGDSGGYRPVFLYDRTEGGQYVGIPEGTGRYGNPLQRTVF